MKRLIAILLFLLIPTFLFAGSQTTSSITAQTLITSVRLDLAETSVSFWADADFVRWADQAVREIVYRTKCLETDAESVTLVANTWSYALSTAFLDVETVIYDSGDTTSKTQIYTLDRTDIKSIGHSKETGPPKVFCVWNDALLIWPVPRSSESGTTLSVYLDTSPSGVTVTTSPIETPSYFDPVILDYMRAQAHYKERQPLLGDYYMKRFNARIDEYIAKIIKRAP
jgi:hypothetical protein